MLSDARTVQSAGTLEVLWSCSRVPAGARTPSALLAALPNRLQSIYCSLSILIELSLVYTDLPPTSLSRRRFGQTNSTLQNRFRSRRFLWRFLSAASLNIRHTHSGMPRAIVRLHIIQSLDVHPRDAIQPLLAIESRWKVDQMMFPFFPLN